MPKQYFSRWYRGYEIVHNETEGLDSDYKWSVIDHNDDHLLYGATSIKDAKLVISMLIRGLLP
jgi:hypothetical protein